MANTPNVKFKVSNNLPTSDGVGDFVVGLLGPTKRGKINNPDVIIKTWPEFVKIYGGYDGANQFPILCERMLNRGAALRICRVAHYSDIANLASLTATKSTLGKTEYKLAFDADTEIGNVINIMINGVNHTFVVNSTHDDTLEMVAKLLLSVSGVIDTGFDTTDNGSITISFGNVSVVNQASVTVESGTAPVITITSTLTSNENVEDADGHTLFTISPKSYGADGNNISILIDEATNGDDAYFNLVVMHADEPNLNEVYENIFIVGNPTAATSTYLDAVNANSNLITITYSDLSSINTLPITPVKEAFVFKNGSNGGSIVDLDYIGNASAFNGLRAFDNFSDMYVIAAPTKSSNALMVALDSYVSQRKDLVGVNQLVDTTKDNLKASRTNTNTDSPYINFVGASFDITSPETGLQISIPTSADLMGCYAYTFNNYFPWSSPFGTTRGVVPNVLAVNPNFGNTVSFNDLNALAQAQINMPINKDNKIYFTHNTNARKANDAQQQVSVQFMILWMIRQLRPIITGFIDEPTDLAMAKQMYYSVKPTLDYIVNNRGAVSIDWMGDQFAKNMDSLVINNKPDMSVGKYKVKAKVYPIAGLKEVEVEIELSTSGVNITTN